DLVVQAQFCAALNRHVIDLNAAEGITQDWSDSTKFFKTEPYNAYVQFWHRADISWEQSSYGFCYDDVFEYSSTINAPSATNATVTIGGFYTELTALRVGQKTRTVHTPVCSREGGAIQYLRHSNAYNIQGRVQR
ncbi:MAG: beta-1,3-glucanase family protein, partial [Fibrobacteraceae bacterium]|nr:beta-1,3-glucanase family protein [Fibrobacteraceae bacterium]